MKIMQKDDVQAPAVDTHGVTVYELVGRTSLNPSQAHSLAHILIPSGKISTPHYHPEAEETFYILKGKAEVRIEDETALLLPGQCVRIPPPCWHSISNPGEEDLEFLAVCTPAWEIANSVFERKEPA